MAELRTVSTQLELSPTYHVAVYIGGGQMISAPRPGQLVGYQVMRVFSDYTGATRPG